MGVQLCVSRGVTQVIPGCNNMSVQVCAIPVLQDCTHMCVQVCVLYIRYYCNTRLVISLEIYQTSLSNEPSASLITFI